MHHFSTQKGAHRLLTITVHIDKRLDNNLVFSTQNVTIIKSL